MCRRRVNVSKELKDIEKMDRRDLESAYYDLMDDYERLQIINSISKKLNRILFKPDLQKIEAYVDYIYKNRMAVFFSESYGVRDNIHDMADGFLAACRPDILNYINIILFNIALDEFPEIAKKCPVVTDDMEQIYKKRKLNLWKNKA